MMPEKISEPEPDPASLSPNPPPIISIDCQHKEWSPFLAAEKAILEQAIAQTIDRVRPTHKLFEVSLAFVDDHKMQKLNAEYRNKNKPTNVLSFPQFEYFSDVVTLPEPVMIGDVVLAWETLNRESQEQDKTLLNHVAHMLVHGTLHLLGYDHQTDIEAEEMENLERSILRELGIGDPYKTDNE